QYTVRKYGGLTLAGAWCFNPVGGLEVATTPQRWADLKRRHGWATSWGVPSFLRSPDECARLHPLLDTEKLLGGFHIPGDGLARQNTELGEASKPILRHQGADLYFREHVDRMGVGAYGHAPMPVPAGQIGDPREMSGMPSERPFTPADFEPSWADAVDLLPVL